MRENVRRAAVSDLEHICPNLRKEDIEECRAFLGVDPGLVLPLLVRDHDAWVMVNDQGKLVGIFGVAPVEGQPLVGSVWMMATPDLKNHKIEFLRNCEKCIDMMHSLYPILWAFTDARNKLHHKWLKWCGFSFIDLKPTGASGLPFYEVIRIKESR